MLNTITIVLIVLGCLGLGLLLLYFYFIFESKEKESKDDVELGVTIFTSEHSQHLFPPLSRLHPHNKVDENGNQPHPISQQSHYGSLDCGRVSPPALSLTLPDVTTLDYTDTDGGRKIFQAPVKQILKPREIIITPRKLPSLDYSHHLNHQGDSDIDKEINLKDPVKPTHKPREINIRPNKSLTSVSKPTRKRQLLSALAIKKHIHPECNTNADAINISEERDRFSRTDANHVFKISPAEFEENESVFQSIRACPYWECQKNQAGNFQVKERGEMFAIFRKSDCHLLVDRCRETRQRLSRPGNNNKRNRRNRRR